MAGTLSLTPTYGLTPTPQKIPTTTNYIKDFNFLNQYLPEQYQKEFERYGNRSVASFLRMLSAEIPFASDLIKWSEQGRLHTKYTDVYTTSVAGAKNAAVQFSAQTGKPVNFRVGQTVLISQNSGSATNKGVITVVAADGSTFNVAFYEASQAIIAGSSTTNLCTVFVYGSEFQKGQAGMVGSLEAQSTFFDNKPIIIKENYEVSGSDMAQIGWVEVSDETGGGGYLWYLKSSHETRTRFEDYLEMSMVEGKPAETNSGAYNQLSPTSTPVTGGTTAQTSAGTKGLFYEVENRGNVWSGGNPNTLNDFDAVIQRLDKQGAIQENAIFLNRQFSFDIDDMLAAQSASAMGGSSFGLFDNDKDMALNLGFSGFRRGYDFYKTDWKYLNDAQTRGDLVAGAVNGVLVPAGSTTVYDQVLGKNAKRPFLHVRYRKSEVEDRKYKSWVTGGAGGASNSDVDSMKVNFLSERALCVLGANNFFIFKN
jgi:hypothetical protein